MKRTKEIGGKLLKYAEERLQESQARSEKLMKYMSDVSNVGKELIYSSILMAGHKAIKVEPEGQA